MSRQFPALLSLPTTDSGPWRFEVCKRVFIRPFCRGSLAVTVATSFTACGHVGSPAPWGPTYPVDARASSISRSEIDVLMRDYRSAYELIRKARPGLLVSHEVRLPYPTREGAPMDPSGMKVFVNDVYAGGIDALTTIPSRSIVFVQRLSPSDATTRYGSGMTAGVIAITTSADRR